MTTFLHLDSTGSKIYRGLVESVGMKKSAGNDCWNTAKKEKWKNFERKFGESHRKTLVDARSRQLSSMQWISVASRFLQKNLKSRNLSSASIDRKMHFLPPWFHRIKWQGGGSSPHPQMAVIAPSESSPPPPKPQIVHPILYSVYKLHIEKNW